MYNDNTRLEFDYSMKFYDAVIESGLADSLEAAEQFCEDYTVDIVSDDYYDELYNDMAREWINDMAHEENREALERWLNKPAVANAIINELMAEDDLTPIPGTVIPGTIDGYLRILG